MLRIERMSGHAHHQAAVLHSFQADDQVGEVLHAGGFAVDDQHFEAGIMIQMRVTRGDNQVVVLCCASVSFSVIPKAWWL